MKFVNRICPNCENPNYIVWIGDFSKEYKYKCVNCHRCFNDIDFEKEPLQPVWKSECMNTKADMVEVVRCKYCEHSKEWYGDKRRCFMWHESGIDVFEDGFCNYGKRK